MSSGWDFDSGGCVVMGCASVPGRPSLLEPHSSERLLLNALPSGSSGRNLYTERHLIALYLQFAALSLPWSFIFKMFLICICASVGLAQEPLLRPFFPCSLKRKWIERGTWGIKAQEEIRSEQRGLRSYDGGGPVANKRCGATEGVCSGA